MGLLVAESWPLHVGLIGLDLANESSLGIVTAGFGHPMPLIGPLLPLAGVPPLQGSSPTGGLGREDVQGHLPLVGTSLMDPLYLHLQARMVEKSHQMVLGELLSSQCPPLN